MMTMTGSAPVTHDHRRIRVANCFGTEVSGQAVILVWAFLIAALGLALALL
ncbi:hypothetical protein [Nocardia blacklockiae]|uniref:hypothetical protein n=1 Tax=Nocardia blacklockiae TaxID=480036 RepID=UPI001895FB87|nr:hypothetical protein [Nocardia blacklockiae]MBF6176479.1 hypothetical protein [Nocardia blacklockiae]